MELHFLESGIDSLKKGFKSLIKYEELFLTEDAIKERFYYLKDAVLFIQHGIEILLKQILISHSEYLVFSQIDESVKKAYIEKNNRKLNSVFESSLKHKLHTVPYWEAIDRVKIIPNIMIAKNLEKKLEELEIYRNIFMHSEAHLSELEINKTFDGLSDELDVFFYDSIGSKYKTISGYSFLQENFEVFKDLLIKRNLELKVKVIEIFLKSFKNCGISIGINEVKRITNIDTATKLFHDLFQSNLSFGTNLYNGYSSGDVNDIIRISDNMFSMHTSDTSSNYDFKFKSIIIFVPKFDSDSSPIIYIESDDDSVEDQLNQYVEEYWEVKALKSIFLKKLKKTIYNPKEISKIYNKIEFNDSEYEQHFRFLTKGLFCFLNVQYLEYNQSNKSLIYENKFLDGKMLEVLLRKSINKNI